MLPSDTNTEKGHGRVTTRQARLYSMDTLDLDARWDKSGLQTLVVVDRETFNVSKEKTSYERAYYITNTHRSISCDILLNLMKYI